MKIRRIIISPLLILGVFVVMANCATKPYVAKDNEELYGTWIFEAGLSAADKEILRPDGIWESYSRARHGAIRAGLQYD